MTSILRLTLAHCLFTVTLLLPGPALASPGTYAYVAAGAQTATVTVQEQTLPDGAALRLRGSGLAADGTTARFEAEASASLRRGELKAFGSSDRPYPSAGTGIAAAWDRMTFHSPGASPSEVTRVPLAFDIHGIVSPYGSVGLAAWQFLFGFADGATTAPSRDLIGSNTLSMGWSPSTGPEADSTIRTAGGLSATYDILSVGIDRFVALLRLEYAGPTASISFAWQLLAGASDGSLDFSNTARITLATPVGTSFTSDSGVFLVGPAAVPAPAGAGVLGVGLIGLALVRRRA